MIIDMYNKDLAVVLQRRIFGRRLAIRQDKPS